MDQIKQYLQRNWLKLGLVAVVIFIAVKKDLSFKLHLNSPNPVEQIEGPATPVQQPSKPTNTERFSDNKQQESVSDAAIASFDFTPGTSSRKKLSAYDQLTQIEVAVIQRYIDRFDQVVINEREKFGIPSSIILANALLHSQAGTTKWSAKNSNNHFALPCTSDWRGATKNDGSSCFRLYENAWTSFRDHSLYITTGAFTALTKHSSTDYKSWANGLEANGFLKEPELAKQLIRTIEKYELYRLDD